MTEQEWMAEQFEEHRAHLRGVAYRMLGSVSDAEDAVQDTWLRLSRSDASTVENLRAWLTTVVARVALNILRARAVRREERVDEVVRDPAQLVGSGTDAEQEHLLADSVGLALMVVLERLTPAERLAFVLHDMFDLSFDEIAPIVGRTPAAARQLASRARRRVQGGAPRENAELARRREVVEAFLAASRSGNFDALVAVLDPDVVIRVDEAITLSGNPVVIRGSKAVARGALGFSPFASFCSVASVDGAPGIILAPRGRLARVLTMKFARGKIVELEVIAQPDRLARLELSLQLDEGDAVFGR